MKEAGLPYEFLKVKSALMSDGSYLIYGGESA